MTVVLPTPENNSGPNDWSDCFSNDKALKEALETTQAELATAESSITATKAEITALKAESPVTWYTPKIIATEESRTNTAFGTLTTPDEIASVVLPTNGLIAVGYSALVKNSVESAGLAAIFLGSNAVKRVDGHTGFKAEEALALGVASTTQFGYLSTTGGGLMNSERAVSSTESVVTTGQIMGMYKEGQGITGGLTYIFAAAGTYTVSIRFKATSGTVTAKERKLWVATLG